ncbi:MAG: FkbM family methyltransferase, partial [Nitrososphaerota archaeon]
IDFAKIDVEGAELLVLQGMKTLPNKMILEFNTENLKEHGTTPTEFFNFVKNYSIKQITKDGLIEPNYEKLLADKMATNLFLY